MAGLLISFYAFVVHATVAVPILTVKEAVVLRYRIFLEQKHDAPTTIKLRLAAVRRVAYEAAGLESVPGTGSR